MFAATCSTCVGRIVPAGILDGSDGLPIFHGLEPLGFVKVEPRRARGRVDVIVDGARSHP